MIQIGDKSISAHLPNIDNAKNLLNNLFFHPRHYNLGKVGRYKLNKRLGEAPDTANMLALSREDLVNIVRHIIMVNNGQEAPDDIDHLSNRRLRTVGELIQNQLRVALLNLERMVRERMSIVDTATVTPNALINTRPITTAIRDFFSGSQLCQFMDQTNPLAELTHKRRLSTLGPGGLSRERAGFEVRDIHHSHYGRICPIETPEGPNIGLIASLLEDAPLLGMRLQLAAIGGGVGQPERFDAPADAPAHLTPHAPEALPSQAEPGERPAQQLHALGVPHAAGPVRRLTRVAQGRCALAHQARTPIDQSRVELHEMRPGAGERDRILGREHAADADAQVARCELSERTHRLERQRVQRRARDAADLLVAVGCLGSIIGREALKVGMPAESVYMVETNAQAIDLLRTLIAPSPAGDKIPFKNRFPSPESQD